MEQDSDGIGRRVSVPALPRCVLRCSCRHTDAAAHRSTAARRHERLPSLAQSGSGAGLAADCCVSSEAQAALPCGREVADHQFVRVFSLITLAAAVFGSYVAYLTYALLCFGELGGSTMCPNANPSTTMTLQLVVGLVGVVPAAYFVFCVFRNRRRQAAALLIGGLLMWAGWAVLNDAAVHGWGDSMRLIP
jgi:hypothetical protein